MADAFAPDGEPFEEYLIRGYVDRGMSIRALSTETGTPYGTVHRHLSRAGVTMRTRASRGGKEPAQRPDPSV